MCKLRFPRNFEPLKHDFTHTIVPLRLVLSQSCHETSVRQPSTDADSLALASNSKTRGHLSVPTSRQQSRDTSNITGQPTWAGPSHNSLDATSRSNIVAPDLQHREQVLVHSEALSQSTSSSRTTSMRTGLGLGNHSTLTQAWQQNDQSDRFAFPHLRGTKRTLQAEFDQPHKRTRTSAVSYALPYDSGSIQTLRSAAVSNDRSPETGSTHTSITRKVSQVDNQEEVVNSDHIPYPVPSVPRRAVNRDTSMLSAVSDHSTSQISSPTSSDEVHAMETRGELSRDYEKYSKTILLTLRDERALTQELRAALKKQYSREAAKDAQILQLEKQVKQSEVRIRIAASTKADMFDELRGASLALERQQLEINQLNGQLEECRSSNTAVLLDAIHDRNERIYELEAILRCKDRESAALKDRLSQVADVAGELRHLVGGDDEGGSSRGSLRLLGGHFRT